MHIRDILISGSAKLPGDYRPQGDEPLREWQGIVLTIKVPGTPLGKPRMTRRDKWARRACVVRYRDWADKVRDIAGAVPPAESVRRLSWIATFEPPKSWSARKREAAIGMLHRSKPDRDNIDKAILDALYPDGDAAIAAGTVEKRWGAIASLVITIELV
jgi:Holliday junction resolvase RusA-like endonuclease